MKKLSKHNISDPNIIVEEFRNESSIASEPMISQEEYEKVQAAQSKESAVLYLRVSNHPNANESLERQRQKLSAYCEAQGYQASDEICAVGSRQQSLPMLRKAIECAKNTEGKTLMMQSSKIVVGTVSELEEIANLIAGSGITIKTMDESYENAVKLGGSTEWLVLQTLADIDAEE